MDTSKGSLEPVRGPKLPVKVGKDMTADKVRVLTPRKHSEHQFFLELENYVLPYPDTKRVYHIPGTDELFTVAKYKKELGKPYSKFFFCLCKDEEHQSSLLKGFTDSVSQMYSFL